MYHAGDVFFGKYRTVRGVRGGLPIKRGSKTSTKNHSGVVFFGKYRTVRGVGGKGRRFDSISVVYKEGLLGE